MYEPTSPEHLSAIRRMAYLLADNHQEPVLLIVARSPLAEYGPVRPYAILESDSQPWEREMASERILPRLP